VLRKRTRKHFAGSLGRREGYQQLVFVVLLWYSPLVQNAASMYRCQYDPEDGWVLVTDPRVSCEESFLRGTTRVHAIAVIAIVGAGLPLFVFQQTLQLRKNEDLSGNSIYAGLFEWYLRERIRAYFIDELNQRSLCTHSRPVPLPSTLAGAHLLTLERVNRSIEARRSKHAD